MGKNEYIIRGKKIVTVGYLGTIENGAIAVKDGLIANVGKWDTIKTQYGHWEVIDHTEFVITPSLIDCHTHLLEFAPTSLYPNGSINHFDVGKDLLLKALASGITALGEQICGHPSCDYSIAQYRKVVEDMPLDISFAATSISIGFEKLVHFSAVTRSQSIAQVDLFDPVLVRQLAQAADYPGENVFINATPANFATTQVPRAGEVMYTLAQLKEVVHLYHQAGKQIGTHVAGERSIRMALEAGFDVLHHAHGITDALVIQAAKQGVKIVATPIGGTHLKPNSPEDIMRLMIHRIPVSISTDAYLPPFPGTSWLPFEQGKLIGPDQLMAVAAPAMQRLKQHHYDENAILALLTANPADILGKAARFGKLEKGMEANFLVAEGVPGLEIVEVERIKQVFYRGEKVVDR